jgi:hypothetical protein
MCKSRLVSQDGNEWTQAELARSFVFNGKQSFPVLPREKAGQLLRETLASRKAKNNYAPVDVGGC